MTRPAHLFARVSSHGVEATRSSSGTIASAASSRLRISSEEAVARAVNEIAAVGGGFVLSHPRHRAVVYRRGGLVERYLPGAESVEHALRAVALHAVLAAYRGPARP